MIRQPETDADFELCVSIKNAVEPSEPVTAEQIRRTSTGAFFLHDGGGYAFVDRSSVVDSAFAMVRVAPDARGRGIGSALLEAAHGHARTLGVPTMWGRVAVGDEVSLGFVRRRGFDAVGRDVELVRVLAAWEGEVPAGIVELGDEHRSGAYAVAVECTPDMPTAGRGRAQAKPFDDWAAGELAGPVVFVALDGGRVVGYAALHDLPATPHRLEQGLTAVVRSHRGRGLAQKLKRAQIAWAANHGYRELVTHTSEENAAMRAVNVRLGYVERPAAIVVKGSTS